MSSCYKNLILPSIYGEIEDENDLFKKAKKILDIKKNYKNHKFPKRHFFTEPVKKIKRIPFYSFNNSLILPKESYSQNLLRISFNFSNLLHKDNSVLHKDNNDNKNLKINSNDNLNFIKRRKNTKFHTYSCYNENKFRLSFSTDKYSPLTTTFSHISQHKKRLILKLEK